MGTTTSSICPASCGEVVLIEVHRPLASGGRAVVRFTERGDGDFEVASPGVAERRSAVDARPATWLDEQHGVDVVMVEEPGQHAGARADGAVTGLGGVVLVAEMADCAPVAIWSADGAAAVVHAGWRGLASGVLEVAVRAIRGITDAPLCAELGPCIRPECYPFGADDLDRLGRRFGPLVLGRATTGEPSFDLPAAVRSECLRLGLAAFHDWGHCTACSPRFWSWRAGRDVERHAMFVVVERP